MSDYSRLIPSISRVLLSKAAIIDFIAHGMHVSGAGYIMVWFFITQGWIKLRVDLPSAPQIKPGAGAEYKAPAHTLWFPRDSYGKAPDERAAILHECTHALRDIMLSSAFIKNGLYGSNIKDSFF